MPLCSRASPLPPSVIMPSRKSVGCSGMRKGLQRSCAGDGGSSKGVVRNKGLSNLVKALCSAEGRMR